MGLCVHQPALKHTANPFNQLVGAAFPQQRLHLIFLVGIDRHKYNKFQKSQELIDTDCACQRKPVNTNTINFANHIKFECVFILEFVSVSSPKTPEP